MKQTFDSNNPNIEWFDPDSSFIENGLRFGEVVYRGDSYEGVQLGASQIVTAIEQSTDSDNLADPMVFTEEEVEAALAHNELEVTDTTSDEDGVDYDSPYFKGSFANDPTAQIVNGVRNINGTPIITGSRLLYATEATIEAFCNIEEIVSNSKRMKVAFIKKEKIKKIFLPSTRAEGLSIIYEKMRLINIRTGVQGLPAMAAACHINGECGYGNLSGIGAYGNLGNFQFDVIANAKAVNLKWPFLIKGSDTKPVDGVDVKYLTANVVHDDLDMALMNYTRWMYSSFRKYWKSFYSTKTASSKDYINAFMLDLASRGYFTGTVEITKEKWSSIVATFVQQYNFENWEEDFELISSKLLSYFDTSAPKLAAEMRSWMQNAS